MTSWPRSSRSGSTQKPLNIHYWDSEYENLCPEVMSQDIWVAYAWQGCYASALYGPLDADGNPQPDQAPPVAYANPVEGRNSWVGLYGISANSDSPELALKFIDDKLATLSCGNAVTLFYYGCANQEVMDGVTDPVLIEAFSLDDPSILETTNFTPLVTAGAARRVDRHVGAGQGPIGCPACHRPRPARDRSRCWDGEGCSALLAVPPYVWLGLFFVAPAGADRRHLVSARERTDQLQRPVAAEPDPVPEHLGNPVVPAAAGHLGPHGPHGRGGGHRPGLPGRLLPDLPGAASGPPCTSSCCSSRSRPATCCGSWPGG